MGFLSSLFRSNPQAPKPWEGLPSLYAFIRQHLDETGQLQASGFSLPDEARKHTEGKVSWAPGAQDGVMSHHVAQTEDSPLAEKIAAAFDRFARSGKENDQIALYLLLRDHTTLSYLDGVISRLAEKATPLNPYLFPFLRWLVKEGPDREPVKAGMALLGAAGDRESEEILLVLGTHDEFTLYTAVALSNLHEDPEALWWDLARKVKGWGRIHLVERLGNTQDPEIQEWILREGFRNEVMDEYLAYIAAVTGDLRSALLREEVDAELLQASGDLIGALLRGGPAPDIDVYEDAAETLTYYVHQLAARTLSDQQKEVLRMIRDYAGDEDKHWQAREQNGWTEENRRQLLSRVDQLLEE